MKSFQAIRLGLFFLAITISSFSTTAIGQTFKFIALGDMPYSLPQDLKRFKTLITEINRLKPSFSIFIGDTKSGSSHCSDEHNQIIEA